MMKPSDPFASREVVRRMTSIGTRPDALTRQETEVLTEAKRAWLEQHPYRIPNESRPSAQAFKGSTRI